MIISDLIRQLEDAQTVHGDLPVAIRDVTTHSWFTVKNVVTRHMVEKGQDSDISSELFVGINL